jgi:hypothetical protein
MKLSEIISTVRNLPRGGKGDFDDNSYSDRQLAFIINYYRVKLIDQDINKGKYLSQYYVQTLGKVKLIKTSKTECGLGDCDLNDFVLRTEIPIPKAVDTNSQNLITYVGTVDGNKSYQRTSFQSVKFDSFSKYTGRNTKYYELGEYLYIVNPSSNSLKYITITGVFEDPLKVNEFKSIGCDDSSDYCFNPFDIEYPLSMKHVDTIYKLIVNTEFRFQNILKFDTENNTKDDNQIKNS